MSPERLKMADKGLSANTSTGTFERSYWKEVERRLLMPGRSTFSNRGGVHLERHGQPRHLHQRQRRILKPAWGNVPGNESKNRMRAEGLCQIPARMTTHKTHQSTGIYPNAMNRAVGAWENLVVTIPGALPQADMKRAFGPKSVLCRWE